LLDLEFAYQWLCGLLETKGDSLYRMKGVLAIAHSDQKYVYHAVHASFEGGFAEPWGAEEQRDSKLVFIGKDLEPEALDASFNACLATSKNLERKREVLRFGVGARVECRIGRPSDSDVWATGQVVQLLFRDDWMPPGCVAPYQVELDGNWHGNRVHVQADKDTYIRKEPTQLAKVRRQMANVCYWPAVVFCAVLGCPFVTLWAGTCTILGGLAVCVFRVGEILCGWKAPPTTACGNESEPLLDGPEHDHAFTHADGTLCDDPSHDHHNHKHPIPTRHEHQH